MNTIKLLPFERQDFFQLIAWITSKDMMNQWAPALFEYPLTEPQLDKYL